MMGAHGQYRELSSQPHICICKAEASSHWPSRVLLFPLYRNILVHGVRWYSKSPLQRATTSYLSNSQITYASFIPISHSFSPVSELALSLNIPCWLKSLSCFSNPKLSYCFNYLPLFLGAPPTHYWISLTQTSGTVWLPVLPIVDTSSLPPDCKQALVINMELLW